MTSLPNSEGPVTRALSNDLRLAVENLIFEAEQDPKCKPSDEAQQAVDKAAGSLAIRLDALNTVADEADEQIKDLEMALHALRNRGGLLRQLIEASLRNSGVERLRSPGGREFAMVGTTDKLEIVDETAVPEEWRKASFTVSGSHREVKEIHMMVGNFAGWPSILVGDVKVTIDVAGAKKHIKLDRDKNGNVIGEIPGFKYEAGRKRLRVK